MPSGKTSIDTGQHRPYGLSINKVCLMGANSSRHGGTRNEGRNHRCRQRRHGPGHVLHPRRPRGHDRRAASGARPRRGQSPGATAAPSNVPPPSPARTSSSSRSPSTALAYVAAEIADGLAGKVVIDVSNRADAGPGRHRHLDRRGAPGPPAARAGSSRHSTRCSPRARPTRSSRASWSTASWPPTTRPPKRRSSSLDGLGFRPVDAGPLAAARTLEGMAWLNITLNM